MTGRTQQVAALLRVTFADGPEARYDCHRCGTTEGPVTGPTAVRVFVEKVREIHASRCTPTTT